MTSVAALVVTHDAAAWVPETLASIAAQTRHPDLIMVVDDRSTDATLEIVADIVPSAVVLASRSAAQDAVTRTAHNFVQGAVHARTLGCELVVLGDHDDAWHPHRVAHQVAVLEGDSALAMVASDGRLRYDSGADPSAAGAGAPVSLREAFPVDRAFASWTPERQLAYALGHSIATGGASAIRVSRLAPALVPPLGWLHDRWWSLAACVLGGMYVDDDQVIDYRVRAGQQVGISRGRQAADGLRRAAGSVTRLGHLVSRARDVRAGLLPMATTREMQQALSLGSIARSAR